MVRMTDAMSELVQSDYDALYDQWNKLSTDILNDLVERFELGDVEQIEDSTGPSADA